jgi:hypothetical protein
VICPRLLVVGGVQLAYRVPLISVQASMQICMFNFKVNKFAASDSI